MKPSPLVILYLDAIPLDVGINTDFLYTQLNNRGQASIGLQFHSPIDEVWARGYDFVTITPALEGKEAVVQYARDYNVDIIHDPHEIFNRKERWAEHDSLLFTTELGDLHTHLEAYLAGYGVAWLASHPIMNLKWMLKYDYRGGLTHAVYQFLYTAREKHYSGKQIEYVRSLLNKVMHIEYARDMLYHFSILKRRAKRLGDGGYYNFELNYHLTSYTFFICSVMDILARLLNDSYKLGYSKFQNYDIEKESFIEKLSVKRKTLADILALKKYREWAELIKIRRNEFTHSSHVYMTPIVMEKQNQLSDNELEALVDKELDWETLESAGGSEEVIVNMRAVLKQELSLKLNYKVVAEDIMTLEREDRLTKEVRQYIVRPLNAIDQDFEKISEIIERALVNLSKERRRRLS